VSAISLPIGAIIAFYWKISKKWNCALLAYGAGALLFALTNEIYGKALCEYDDTVPGSETSMILLGVGSIVGSLIFSLSNYFIENQGGFLRKMALRYKFLKREQKKRESTRQSTRGSARLSRRSISSYGTRPASPGKAVGPGKRVITDLSASLESDARSPLLANPQDPTARDKEPDTTPAHSESSSSEGEHDEDEDDAGRGAVAQQPSSILGHHASHSPPAHINFVEDDDLVSRKEEKEIIEKEFREGSKDSQIGLAIWMGILIDGLPESLVIGLLARDGISFTFIVGVFLSNLPEALSSTVIMQRGGFTKLKILLMWSSITLITGLGAVIGVLLFEGPHTEAKEIAEKFVEGVAAGAMLVMIAETALPEAFRYAGNLVGFATLFGFLSAYYIKLIELLA